MLNPFEISIHNQADDEKIKHVWRHHPVTLIGPILRTIAFLLVPLLIALISGLAMFTSPWLFSIYVIILSICLTYAAYEWVSWYGDVFVLTNYRMVDVDQTGFFHRSFSEASLSKIQDVSYDIKGFIPSVFNFGTIIVQTAGLENIEMTAIRDPAYQTKLLLQAQENYVDEHGSHSDEMSAEDLIRLLNKHHKDLENLPDMEKEENRQRVRENLAKVKDKEQKKKSFRKKKEDEGI